MSKQAVDAAFVDGYWLDMNGVLRQEQHTGREERARGYANDVVAHLKEMLREFRRSDYDEALVDAVEVGKRIGVCLRDKETNFKPKGDCA